MTSPDVNIAEEPAPRAPGFPATLLALVERGAPDDGVAYIGLLVERALRDLAPRSRTITVFSSERGGGDASFVKRGLFTARLMAAGRRSDCVVYNHVGVATVQAGVPRAFRRPYAVIVHGAEAWGAAGDLERRGALAGATLVLTTSTYAAQRVAESHPDAPRAEVCPPALLPPGDRGAVDGALVATITPRTIVISGRMNAGDARRGHDELLEAWQTILGRRPDARLAIVGRGDDVKRLEAKATRLGVMGSMRFTGYVTEATLDAMLARAGGYAQPSTAAGSALGLLRAMRAGVPCIAGIDAGSEVVEDGATGLVVDAGERDAVANAVISLLGDTARRRAMGEAARARYEATFTFDHFLARLDGVMRAAFPPLSSATARS